jgi:hypothetical protein
VFIVIDFNPPIQSRGFFISPKKLFNPVNTLFLKKKFWKNFWYLSTMGKGAQTRRADRQSAREEKKTNIESGMDRKEARETKHETKQEDRKSWEDNGDAIGQSIAALGTAIGDAIVDDPDIGVF